MRIKNVIYYNVACVLILLSSCSETKEKEHKAGSIEYKIHGDVAGFKGPMVYLEEIKGRDWITIDSVETNNGSFDMEGFIAGAEVYKLRFNDNMYIPVFVGSTPVSFTADIKDLFVSVQFKEDKENQTYADFNRTVLTLNKQHGLLTAKLDALKSLMAADPHGTYADSADVYMIQLKSLEADMNAFIKKSIDENLNSPIVFNMITYADWENDFPYVESVTNKIKQNLPDNKYTTNLVANVNQYKTYQLQQAAQQEKSKSNPGAIGKEAPEFALPDANGNMIRLSSYRGKYVLIDFWASWCGPCRQESPNVVRAYNKYKGKNFDILGVSLDDKKDKWLQAIAKDGLIWNQVSELKSWQSSVVSLYKLESIPATYLLDPNGIVIARDLRGADLEAKLEELLKK